MFFCYNIVSGCSYEQQIHQWRQISTSECSRGTLSGRNGRCRGAEGVGFNADSIANPFLEVIGAIVLRMDDDH